MPMYDYRCQSCGARFEVWQKISDAPVEVCPTCSGHVQRVIHATGLLFKGSGFYITDTRGSSVAAVPEAHEGNESQNGKDGATADVAKSETKSETKSEAKSDAKSESASSSKADGKGAAPSSTTTTAPAQAG
ncbi:MAG: zinc ribbon domain-containing protein [Ktedonobacterales bacterium]